MDKKAQKRSVLNQLREKINMPGSYLEGFFKPELDRVMSALKDLDDRIRSVLTGKKIGNAEVPADGVAVKDLLKSARTNFNRREYMAGVADLGRFHKKMFDVSQDIGKFFVDVNKIHNKFLFEGLPEGYDKHIESLREHMSRATSTTSEYFVKEAGIMDFFYNIGTKRGRSLAAWEKKYPKQTKELREGGDRLINEAQKLLDNAIIYLKQMATSRAVRRPDDYMDIANKIKSEFDKFDAGDKGFKAYYNNAIVPWLKIKDEIEAKEKVNTAPIQQPETPASPSPTSSPSSPDPRQVELGAPPIQATPPLGGPPGASPPFTPPVPEEQAPDTERTPAVLPEGVSPQTAPKVRVAHQSFYNSLSTMTQENPSILAKYIAKYASFIQKNDPETAIKLFNIVRRIKE